MRIHFVHARGIGPRPIPPVITHGWPSSFAEIAGIVGPLSDPAAHGGDPKLGIDVGQEGAPESIVLPPVSVALPFPLVVGSTE